MRVYVLAYSGIRRFKRISGINRLHRVLFLALLSQFSFFYALAQTTITGKVTDLKGEPLKDATVSVKDKSRSAIVRENGTFTISAKTGDVLVFSHIGYKPIEYKLSDNDKTVAISLEESVESGEEVFVVAYGKQKKSTITGAIASIQTKEIKQSPAANLAVTLAGRLPGLTAIQRSGEPGADATELYIRGRGTSNAQSPIVLVDGIERELTFIDPNEIESVTILKDASSTALFGVRGANGVILVTTKRGSSEIPEINFTAEVSAQRFTRLIKPVNAYQFATLRNLAQANDGLAQTYSAADIEHYRLHDDPIRYPDNDWVNILTKKYSPQQRYNLNISGAVGKAVKYFVNVGYLGQGSQFRVEDNLSYDPSFNLKRYNFRSNIDIQLNKSLKAFLNIAGTIEKQNGPANLIDASTPISFYVLASMNQQDATTPGPLTPDGKVLTNPYVAGAGSGVPYGTLNRSGYQRLDRTTVIGSYGMEQALDFITPGLSAKAMVSFDTKATNLVIASKTYERYVEVVNPTTKEVSYVLGNNIKESVLSIKQGAGAYTSLFNLQAFLNYDKKFGKHAVTGLVLFQKQTNIINVDLPYNMLGVASRLTYGYDNKYFAEFNAGYNGSEQFAKGKRFGFFPAVSGAWVISNENFLKDQNFITNLKVRGSYGKVGNDRLSGSRFQYLDNIAVAAGGYSPSLGGPGGMKINVTTLGNPDLRWEVAKKADVGIEVGLLNSISATIDVFTERRDNILISQSSVPALNGLALTTLPKLNFGVIENKGYELELNYRKAFNKDLSVLVKVNYSHARNIQLFTDEAELPADYAYRYRKTGYPIGQRFGYIVDRYFTDSEDIVKSPVQSVGGHESRPGDFKYKDLNHDGVVNTKDNAPIGYADVPENQFGFALNINYKTFDVSVLMQGVSHVYQYFQLQYGSFEGFNYVDRHLDSWTAERAASGYDIKYPRLTTQASPNNMANTFFVVNASYIRLKNIEIGYSLPSRISKKVGSKGIRLYVNGLNLYTWDKMPTREYDPELGAGLGNLAYPQLSVYNLGVNVKF